MVAQKIKILSKRTVCAFALVTLSDAKQDFIVPREKQRCMENGILYVFIAFVFTTNIILSTRQDFFIRFEKLSLQNR